MPTFTYEAIGSAGKPVSGKVEASDEREAIATLRRQGVFPTAIQKAAAGGMSASDIADEIVRGTGGEA